MSDEVRNDINNELDERETESWIRLIRVLTHEIMNSITPITSLSDTLLGMENKVEGEVREGLEAINSTGRSLIRFVEAYRKVTRIPTPRLTSFYVKPFLERMAKLAEPYTRKENASVRLRVTPSDLLVYADEDLIGQVVLNLLKNAAHAVAGKPDGEIVVTAYCTETEQVAVDVTDNGCGIPADVAVNIFVPFFTTKPNGSGIGLSVSRQIMRMHNGSIMLKHSLAGKTTFMLLFN